MLVPINWIVDFFKGFFGLLGDLLGGLIDILLVPINWIIDFFKGFFNLLGELLKTLFVPSDSYLSDNFGDIKKELSDKMGIDLSILENLTKAREVRGDIIGPISFNLFGKSLSMDLSFIERIQPYTRAISAGLSAIFLCWYDYKHIVAIIRKAQPIEGQGGGGGNSNLPSVK